MADKMGQRKNFAVIEVISSILVFMIVSGAICFITVWAVPMMDDQKAGVRAESVALQFINVNKGIQDLISQGQGSSRDFNIVTNMGYITTTSEGPRFVIYYSWNTDYEFDISGLDDDTDFTLHMVGMGKAPIWDVVQIKMIDLETDVTIYTSEGDDEWDNTADPIEFSCSYDLYDAIRIDVKIKASIGGPWNLIGRIWLFDIGNIEYETSSSSSTYHVRIENGGVMNGKLLENLYFPDEPKIIKRVIGSDTKDYSTMRMVQVEPTDVSGVGSSLGIKGSYELFLELDSTSALEKNKLITSDLKIQVFGDSADSWINYFKIYHEFEDDTGSSEDPTISLDNVDFFSLSFLQFDVTLDVRT